MKAKLTHRWDLTVEEAMRLQWELSAKVVEEDELPETVRYIAGADVHQIGNDQMQAVVCVLTFPELELVEVARATVPVTFPYVPGLLAFRESPAVLKAFEQLRHDPDIALFDAQGRAHPRHFGLACHMGWSHFGHGREDEKGKPSTLCFGRSQSFAGNSRRIRAEMHETRTTNS